MRKLVGKNGVASLLFCSFHRTEMCKKTTTTTCKIITEDSIAYIFAFTCKTTDLPANNSKVRSIPWLEKNPQELWGEYQKLWRS